MSAILNTYQNVLSSYQKFSSLKEGDAEFRPAQKALFSSISALFPSLGLLPVEALGRDVYYYQAKLINQGITFQNRPGSLNRLNPLAKNYCLTFNEIISSLRNPPPRPEPLKEKFERLGIDHLRFATAFVPEMLAAAPETTTAICLKYPQTLTLFLDVVFPHIQALKPQIEAMDGNFLTLTLPSLAIEKLLADPTHLPEFFIPYSGTLIKKSKTWGDLSQIEKVKLHRKIVGDDVELAPVTQQLYQSIRSIATEIHSNLTHRKEFTMISKVTFTDLENAYQILAALPPQKTNPANDLIYALLSKPEIPIPDALFEEKYRLPLVAMRKQGANPQQIEQLALAISAEPKVSPWLKLRQ